MFSFKNNKLVFGHHLLKVAIFMFLGPWRISSVFLSVKDFIFPLYQLAVLQMSSYDLIPLFSIFSRLACNMQKAFWFVFVMVR